MAAALLVLAVMGGTAAWRPGAAGYAAGAVFALFILAPLLGYRVLQRRTLAQQYGRARRLAALLRWLHPADGWWTMPSFLAALESGRPEALADAARRWHDGDARRTPLGRLGLALLYRMGNQWEELRRWIQTGLSPDELRHEPSLIALYLRAHGELGDPNALVAAFGRLEKALESDAAPLHRNACRLMPFAFCGRKEPLARLFRGPLDFYPGHVQRFWLATAEMASGDAAAAREMLEALRGGPDALTVAGVERRLSQPLPVAEELLTPESREILARAEAELAQEERYGARPVLARRRPRATYAIIFLNALVFGVEMALGGSTNGETLDAMGALLPSAVLAGEWWRVVAALFLHYGFLHLLVNMVALAILGPFLEFAVGAVRYVLVYLAAGVGSMLVVVALAWTGWLDDQFLVGASGGIMGLVGGTAAVLLRGWRRERARVAARRLTLLVFVIAFQVVFDLATPQVSFTAHFGGVVIGFAVASLMAHRIGSKA